MSSKAPIFPIFEPQQFSDEFYPQINYFQEARKHKSRTVESSKKIKKTKNRWWSNPLLLFKSSRKRELVSRRVGPVYVTDSRTGSCTPYRTARKPGSGPVKKGEVDIPYISLKELNMDVQRCKPAIPIYLVT